MSAQTPEGTSTRPIDSEPVVTPRHTADGHVHSEVCRPLVGHDYPSNWCTVLEDGWQQRVDDVDTDLFVQTMLDHSRALVALEQSLACHRVGQSVVSVARVCPRPFGTGDDTHARQTRPTDTTTS